MKIRQPNIFLGAKGSFGEVVGVILAGCERIMRAERPDKFLVLGDTNSALAAFIAKRLGIPVYHMEAGNRCYDDRVPEEVNRRVIDHSSDVLMPYTERSRANLLREGIEGQRDYFEPQITASSALADLGLEAGRYFLVTLHRAENVDQPARLEAFIRGLNQIHARFEHPIICSLHPRTRSQLAKQSKVLDGEGIRAVEPLGFFDFVHLEKHALCVLSDSGTVQEECCIFGVPNVTLRDVTERPETIEVGSNMLSGADPDDMLRCVETVLAAPPKWLPPPEYLVPDVSQTVVRIALGYRG
jgi:UDP-N-acetylglucosamine 2-epimerase (non-hydrolysing)